ncbi:hypothetical protein [Sorangium sp. So ce426]|uniref:hypothetical protein n=1 Tax=Sorangium sp. So ce426 TaxID=3133312 RepID=UPI003F5BBC66
MSTEAPVTSISHFTKDTQGRRYAHVLAKRTYRLPRTRAPEVAPEQLAIVSELVQMILELFGGAPRELAPGLRTVILRPDRELLVCVWVGTMPVDRPPTEMQLEKTRHAVRWSR